MLIQDIFEALKIQAIAHNRGWTAGFCDAIMWLMLYFSMDTAITSNGKTRIAIIILITIANVVGQQLGVITGKRLIKDI